MHCDGQLDCSQEFLVPTVVACASASGRGTRLSSEIHDCGWLFVKCCCGEVICVLKMWSVGKF